MERATVRDADEYIGRLEEFHASALWGTKMPGGLDGRLDNSHRERFFDDIPFTDYVVVSYGTPIAWHVNGRWVFPNTKYSPTTTRHQGKTRMGMRMQGDPVEEI